MLCFVLFFPFFSLDYIKQQRAIVGGGTAFTAFSYYIKRVVIFMS